MNTENWETTFSELFDRCCERYSGGDRDFASYYSEDDLAFLASIGCQKRELFDFVEDHIDDVGSEPSPKTALLVAAVRRDYFLDEQGGKQSEASVFPNTLPDRSEELGGIPWLPRILTKAEGKLRGELDPNIMYGCGGDRAFLARHNLKLADFLRAVWEAAGDKQQVVALVQGSDKV